LARMDNIKGGHRSVLDINDVNLASVKKNSGSKE